jgi:hypothetical protein
MRDKIRKETTKKVTFVEDTEVLDRPERSPASETWLVDLMDELSEDGKLVIQLVTKTPRGLKKAMQARGRSATATRRSLEFYLMGLDWTKQRIVEAFEEIKEVLM